MCVYDGAPDLWKAEDNCVLFPPASFTGIPGIELRSSDFRAKRVSCWTTSLALLLALVNL